MTATIKEIRETMFDIDFGLIANGITYNNPKGRRILYNIDSQDLEVNFYIGSSGFFIITTTLI
jgi:hypothetical protein